MGSLKGLGYLDVLLHALLCVAFGWLLAEVWRAANTPVIKSVTVKLEDGFMLYEVPVVVQPKRGEGYI